MDKQVRMLNYATNPDTELGLGVANPKSSKHVIDYAAQLFEQSKTTEFLNENQAKLWFWKYVGFLFVEGTVLESTYRVIFNEVLEYFNRQNQSFLPNVFKIMSYKDDIITKIEQDYNIGHGNYHFMLIPFVMTSDVKILQQAPESAYQKYGPVDVLMEPNTIVEYMCEVMYKYGTMTNLLTDEIANALEVSQPTESDRYFKHAKRIFNISSSHPKTNEPMRMDRKGYFDPNTSDNFDLINPEEDITKYAPQRQYFTPGDLAWKESASHETNYYRRPAKVVPRETLTNTSTIPRHDGKRTGLWNQMYESKQGLQVGAGYIDTTTKGGMMKMNTMYASVPEDRHERYQIYGDTRAPGSQGTDRIDAQGRSISDLHESVYLDTIKQRNNIPTMSHVSIQPPMHKNVNTIPAEMSGIFASHMH